MGPGDFAFIQGEFGMAKQVQGAPYSAEAVTQVNQTLADGNRIQRTITTVVARDSEGRTRIERTMNAIGPLAAPASGRPFKAVFINDPVAGVSYVLNPNNRTMRQVPVTFGRAGRRGQSQNASPGFATRPHAHTSAKNAEQDLGTQTIQGVAAQGKRVTRTIAAGEVGNQRAIDLVTETWYSPDLHVTVMSKSSDPRFGETVYQLTNINRAEPDHSLFVPPSDYTLQTGRPNIRKNQ